MADTVSFARVTSAGRPPVTVAYERRGAGEPLVLLHGIGHHFQAWEPVSSALTASCDVITPDLPGFGQSPALPEPYGYDLSSAVPLLGELFSTLGLERPHVVGNSLGGLLALNLARHGLVRSVTALSPAGFWTEPERRYGVGVLRAMRTGARLLPPRAVRLLARSAVGRAAMTGTIYNRPARRSPEAVISETQALRDAPGFAETLAASRLPGVIFRDDLPDVPVTIAWGAHDRLLLRRQGLRAKRTIPGARLVRLPGCGHVPMNDDPALVSRVILDTVRAAAPAVPPGDGLSGAWLSGVDPAAAAEH